MCAKMFGNKKGTIQMSFTFLVLIILGGLVLTVGARYIAKMGGNIMSISSETSDTMRQQMLQELKQKNAKILLSIPTTVDITRKDGKRDIYVGIKNAKSETQCFCVNAHLTLLDRSVIDNVKDAEGIAKMSIADAISNVKGNEKAVLLGLKQASPKACYPKESAKEAEAECRPNSWFVGQNGISILGEEQAGVTLNMELPRTAKEAPNGRYAFKVDVCTYNPLEENNKDGSFSCDACDPEQCHSTAKDKYEWYASEQFFVRIQTA